MGLDEVLKNVLGDEIYKEKGGTLKKELAKEVIPKSEFNAKLDELKSKDESIKALESEKKLALEELEQSKNVGKSELEKLADNFKKLEQKLEKESELRVKSEEALNNEKLTNSIKGKLSQFKMKPKFIDKYVNDFKDVKDDEFEARMKEFAENNKELFGEEKLNGEKPKGEFTDKVPAESTPKTFAEWKAMNN